MHSPVFDSKFVFIQMIFTCARIVFIDYVFFVDLLMQQEMVCYLKDNLKF